MPAVVYKGYEGPTGFILDALGGATAGIAAAEVKKEEIRQWTADMEYKWRTLQEQVRAGNLNREQQERFQEMDDERTRTLQAQQIDADQFRDEMSRKFTREVEQPFLAAQKELDRFSTERGQDLELQSRLDASKKQLQASTFATTKQFEAETSRQARERFEFTQRDGYLVDVVDQVLAGRRAEQLTPEELQNVSSQVEEALLDRARLTGAPGVTQASVAERAAAKAQAQDYLLHADEKKQAYFDRQLKYAELEANSRAKAAGSLGISTGLRYAPPGASEWVLWKAGGLPPMTAPRASDSMGFKDKNLESQIFDLFVEAKLAAGGAKFSAVFPTTDLRMREPIYDQYKTQIAALVQQMDVKSPEIQEYYRELFYKIMFPETQLQGAPPIPAATAPAPAAPAGGD